MNTEATRKLYKTLSSQQFQQVMNETKNAVLLDVRTEEEFNSERIPNAVNMNVTGSSFAEEIAELDKNQTYFVYCRSGGRSATACSMMTARGLEVYNLSGGITNWTGEVC